MKRNGFTLIEVIVGMFLIGLISTVAFPIIQNSITNYNRVKEKQQMLYLCEMTVERLRAKDSTLEYLFSELESNTEVLVSKIGTTDLGKYKCKITKIKESEGLINLVVRIYIDNEKGISQYVEFKTVVKKT